MRKFLTFALTALVMMVGVGCGGDTPYVPLKTGGTTPPPDFTVSVQQVTPTPVLQEGQEAAKPAVFAQSNPKARPAGEAEGASFMVTVTPINGFTGNVSLQVSNDQGSNGFATNFDPVSVNLTGSQAATSTFSVTLDTTVTPGQYSFAVTGVDGSIRHTASVHPLVIVQGPPATFNMTISPGTVEPLQLDEPGVNQQFTVTLSSVNGFAGKVNLSAANPDPSDLSDSLSNSSVTLTSGSSATVTLTVTLTSRGDGIYQDPEQFIVTGVNGSTQRQVAATVEVED